MNSKTIVIITSVIFVAITALLIILNKANETAEEKQEAGHPPIEDQPTIGEEDAPISIVEFGDFICPSCKTWGDNIYSQLKEDYIDNGQASFSYINVLFHGNDSVLASLAAESVFKQDPDAYWDFHQAIFDAQPTNQNHNESWVTPETLLEIAQSSVPEIDLEQLEKDILEGLTMDELLIDDELVKRFNVQSTPTIMIDGYLMKEPFNYDAIASFIDKRLDETE